MPLSCLYYRLLTVFPQSRLQAWLDSIPPADQPVFRTRQYEEVVELGDTLVAFLTPHYSADDVTRLFLPEPYPTPLPPNVGQPLGRFNSRRNMQNEMEDLSDEEADIEQTVSTAIFSRIRDNFAS